MFFFRQKILIFSVFILAVLLFFSLFSFCLAQSNQLGGLEDTAAGVGYQTVSGDTSVRISSWIGMIISAIVGFIGVIFMVLIFMGAFDIIGAGGNDEQVKKGKDKIKNGVIGILIVFASYLLTNTILSLVSGEGIFSF